MFGPEEHYPLRQHFEVIKQRIGDAEKQEEIDVLVELMKPFEKLPHAMRSQYILNWTTPFSLEPARRIQPSHYKQQVYYEFIAFLHDRRVERSRFFIEEEEEAPKRRVVHLTKWSMRQNVRDILFSGVTLPHYHHEQCLSIERHKLCFALQPCVAKLKSIKHSKIQFIVPNEGSFGETSLITSNCVIKLGRKELFRYMTIRFSGDVTMDIELDGAQFCDNNSTINLLDYTGVNQLCYITACAELTLLFDTNHEGELYINSPDRCSFDLTSCQLSYWSESSRHSVIRYQINDTQYLDNLYRLATNQPILIHADLPENYNSLANGFDDSLWRYRLLCRMKVYHLALHDIPYFFIDDCVLLVTRTPECNTIYYGGCSLATFIFNLETNELSLTMIYQNLTRHANLLEYYVY